MKKILSIIIVAVIAIISLSSVSATDVSLKIFGDVNGDGIVSVMDATLTQKHVSQLDSISDDRFVYADVDCNYTISITDATLIQKKLANLISEFPVELITPTETTEPTKTTQPTQPSGENVPTSQYTPNEMEMEILEIINKHRAEAGVHPLEFGYFYYDCARIRAEEGDRFFSHTRPNGAAWQSVLREYGINNTIRYSGENIAQFYPDAESVMIDFMNSPGHRENILREKFDYVAIAVYESEEYPGKYTIEQLFLSKEIRLNY